MPTEPSLWMPPGMMPIFALPRELAPGQVGLQLDAGAFFMDAAGHDADFGFAWGDDAGAVGAIETRRRVLELGRDFDHVERWNAFSDADDEGDSCVFSFENGIGSKRRRDEDHGGVGAGGSDG